MKCFVVLFAVFLWMPQLHADPVTIFESRKQLPMSNGEQTQKDFYINAGTGAGLAPGRVVTVVRQVPLYDSYRNRSAGNLSIKVAKIKIIYSQKDLSVARYFAGFSRDKIPVLDDNFIMVGDQLDMNSVESEKSAANEQSADSSRSVSSVSAPQPPPQPAPVVAHAQVLVNTVTVSSSAPSPAPSKPPGTGQAPTLQ